MTKHKYWNNPIVRLSVISLIILGCGQNKSPEVTLSPSTNPGTESQESTDYEDPSVPNSEDDLADLSSGGADTAAATAAANEALTTIANSSPNAATVTAINAAKPALSSLTSYLDLFRRYGNESAESSANAEEALAQLHRAMQERFEAAAALLRAANQPVLALIFDQIKAFKPVLRIRSTAGTLTRYYYVSDPTDVPKLRKTIKIKNDGIAFLLWAIKDPIPKDKYPDAQQIATKEVWGCPLRVGGTFVSNQSNCEGRSGINGSPKLLGYSNMVADTPELEIQRFRAKSNSSKYLVTNRPNEKNKPNLWIQPKNLGGGAIPRVVGRWVTLNPNNQGQSCLAGGLNRAHASEFNLPYEAPPFVETAGPLCQRCLCNNGNFRCGAPMLCN